ncbi:hypothetical protein TPR58_22150 [Sphingomonas sp. HF-S3]|jgi:uncharacterized protein (DUF486 family)|uniref:Uncharacterized protein n=1 Tax=Sphingomonas rustica TaxID=3103142 RepID=A0ABV0BGU1_9SPHN
MLRLFPLLIASPALAQGAHSGATATRSMPELSDIALFLFAAFSIWFVRRALRARFRKADAQD